MGSGLRAARRFLAFPALDGLNGARQRQRGTIYGRAQFSWLRNGGTISTNLDVIWGMSVETGYTAVHALDCRMG